MNKIYIALLRGINVGGHKKVNMPQLRTVLTKAGLKNVKTYIQSGNVIFESSTNNIEALEQTIKVSILDHFGFEVPTLVKTKNGLHTLFNTCPFPQEKKENSYFALLSKIPSKDLVVEVSEKTYKNEEFKIIKDCIYFYCSTGYGHAKFNLNFFEKKLKVNATSRNYKTMVKLLSLSETKD